MIRGNRFINTYHAVVVNGITAHILDNGALVPGPERVPNTRHPGLALMIDGWLGIGVPACDRSIIAAKLKRMCDSVPASGPPTDRCDGSGSGSGGPYSAGST